ncbi:MAG: GAF domain-containing protein [Deltaproteobacteria bacterium]|nr:GAF domain-containing protein [Deltaproteobacteria bacterium]
MGAVTVRARQAGVGHASEAPLAAAFAQAPLAMSINALPDGVFVDANDAFLRLFEVTKDELSGRSGVELGLFDDALQRQLRERLAGEGRVLDLECTRTTCRGKPVRVALTITMIDIDGVPHALSMMRDLTYRRPLEGETRREKFLVDVGATLASTLDYQETVANIVRLAVGPVGDLCALGLIDQAGILRNQAIHCGDPDKARLVEALRAIPVDANPAHVVGALVESRRPMLLSEVTPEIIDAVTTNPEHRRVLRGIGAQSAMGAPLVAHGEVLGALFIVSCRPERRYAAEDLPLLEALALRAALAVANARLHQQLLRAVRARDDVLGAVAHDLRNPLAAIVIHASRLRAAVPAGGAENSAEAIRRAAMRVSRLAEDLLDVARVDAGRLCIEPSPLRPDAVVADCVEAQRPIAEAASLELIVDIGQDLPEIVADRDRVQQVLENLVGNAIKFTPAGGSVTVGAAQREREVTFWVSDSGPGIPPEDLPRVFDRYWQASPKSKVGAGLGLAIAKDIVAAHGGRIWVESTLGQGSAFAFTVPARR